MGRGYVKDRPERASEQASSAQVQAMMEKLQKRSSAAQSPQAKSDLQQNCAGESPAGASVVSGATCKPTTTADGGVITPEPPQEGTVSAARPALEWEKPTVGGMAVKTTCGRYSCCKVVTSGRLHYELWKLAGGGSWFMRLDKGSGLDNFMQAQVMAQQDASR
jgi:hypothetical protein